MLRTYCTAFYWTICPELCIKNMRCVRRACTPHFLLKKKTGRARSKRKPLSWAGNPGRNFRHQRWARFGHLSRKPLPALDGTAGDVVVIERTVLLPPRVPLRYALPGAYRAAAAERETEPCDNSPGQDRAAVCGDRFMIPNSSGARGRKLRTSRAVSENTPVLTNRRMYFSHPSVRPSIFSFDRPQPFSFRCLEKKMGADSPGKPGSPGWRAAQITPRRGTAAISIRNTASGGGRFPP